MHELNRLAQNNILKYVIEKHNMIFSIDFIISKFTLQ